MKIAGLTAITAAVVLLAGCKSINPDSVGNVSYKAIAGNPTPELQGLSERPIDIDRNIWMTANQNWRMMYGDLGRFLYFDHPSTLSPYPIEITGGQPR